MLLPLRKLLTLLLQKQRTNLYLESNRKDFSLLERLCTKKPLKFSGFFNFYVF